MAHNYAGNLEQLKKTKKELERRSKRELGQYLDTLQEVEAVAKLIEGKNEK